MELCVISLLTSNGVRSRTYEIIFKTNVDNKKNTCILVFLSIYSVSLEFRYFNNSNFDPLALIQLTSNIKNFSYSFTVNRLRFDFVLEYIKLQKPQTKMMLAVA